MQRYEASYNNATSISREFWNPLLKKISRQKKNNLEVDKKNMHQNKKINNLEVDKKNMHQNKEINNLDKKKCIKTIWTTKIK